MEEQVFHQKSSAEQSPTANSLGSVLSLKEKAKATFMQMFIFPKQRQMRNCPYYSMHTAVVSSWATQMKWILNAIIGQMIGTLS